MKLSVVILNYNVRYFLELCLKSVRAAVSNIEAEIIVVDNHSADDSCEMVRSLFPEVKLITNQDNYGFSKGNNIGIAAAKGEYICILNPDTVVSEHVFLDILKFAESKSNLGIIGCKLIDGTGMFLPESKRNIPTPEVALKKIIGDSSSYYANHITEGEIAEVEILVGAFMVLKREVYQEVGGLDEDYFMYAEDVDLSYKVLKAGYQNYYYGQASAIHFKGESTCRNKTYAKRFNGAMQIFYKKHFKKNVFFETLLSLGVKGLTVLNLQPKVTERVVNSVVLVSNDANETLESVLSRSLKLQDLSDEVQDGQQIILDNNVLTYRQIIDFMESHQSNLTLTYRIQPKDSNFILGSDHAVSRGSVIHF